IPDRIVSFAKIITRPFLLTYLSLNSHCKTRRVSRNIDNGSFEMKLYYGAYCYCISNCCVTIENDLWTMIKLFKAASPAFFKWIIGIDIHHVQHGRSITHFYISVIIIFIIPAKVACTFNVLIIITFVTHTIGYAFRKETIIRTIAFNEP